MSDHLAELHVHLEGTIRHATAVELARTNGLPPPPEYRYFDLASFMAVYTEVSKCLVTSDDFERVIVEHAELMSDQNVDYAEISFNPSLHAGDSWLKGLVAGRQRALDELGVEVAWLVEFVRGATNEVNERALDIALTTEGVVGIGLVGDESFSGRPLDSLVKRAGKAGLGFMPHAGQSGGAEVVREAIDVLGATRIAHGFSAVGDTALMQSLAQQEVCLCICLSSNRRIGLTPDYSRLAAYGIPLSVNTDDPAMVPTTLGKELELASKEYDLSRRDLVAAAWAHRFQPGQR